MLMLLLTFNHWKLRKICFTHCNRDVYVFKTIYNNTSQNLSEVVFIFLQDVCVHMLGDQSDWFSRTMAWTSLNWRSPPKSSSSNFPQSIASEWSNLWVRSHVGPNTYISYGNITEKYTTFIRILRLKRKTAVLEYVLRISTWQRYLINI